MERKKLKICAFSGKRGGFGAYVPMMQLIEADPDLELQILLGDMHASPEFGNTVEEARNFFPKAKIEVIEMGTGRGDTPVIRTENLGTCLKKTASILEKLSPDIIIVHADRGEHLMVAYAALNLGIPIAHTQGGEISGNIDDVQRHALSKLAHIHFPETEKAAEIIKKLGEESWRIHNVGSLYIDRIVKKMYTPLDEVKRKYGLENNEKYFIVIYHSDTFESRENNYQHAKATFEAIKSFGLRSFVVYPCSDPGYQGVMDAIADIKDDPQFIIHKNIDNLDFLSIMKNSSALIGNSSSALVEAPYFQLGVVNIGKRQLGRDREENVIDAEPTEEDIKDKIKYVMDDKDFQEKLKSCGKRLGNGQAAEKIINVLKNTKIDEILLRKKLA